MNKKDVAEFARLNDRVGYLSEELRKARKEPVVAGFPITPNVFLTKTGEHFDIRYKISNHARDSAPDMNGDRGTWCYYVYVNELMLPAPMFAEFWLPPSGTHKRSAGWDDPSYDYWAPRWSDAEWHGGVTWYAKTGGHDGDRRGVEIGCDFSHLWDHEEGYRYDYADIEREAKRTIDALRTMYPFHRRCRWTGRWLPEGEMVEHEGSLYCQDGLAKRLKNRAECEARTPRA
jgi:hypothetical protein